MVLTFSEGLLAGAEERAEGIGDRGRRDIFFRILRGLTPPSYQCRPKGLFCSGKQCPRLVTLVFRFRLLGKEQSKRWLTRTSTFPRGKRAGRGN